MKFAYPVIVPCENSLVNNTNLHVYLDAEKVQMKKSRPNKVKFSYKQKLRVRIREIDTRRTSYFMNNNQFGRNSDDYEGGDDCVSGGGNVLVHQGLQFVMKLLQPT